VQAHAYALASEKLTGVDIKKMLSTPQHQFDKIPEFQKYLDEGSHRRLYRFSADDYKEMAGIWQGEKALPGDPRERLACCWVGAVSLPTTLLRLRSRARAYGFSRSAAFFIQSARFFMSGRACALTMRSGTVSC
jgi:hypothetical protein